MDRVKVGLSMTQFALFDSPLDLAFSFWKSCLKPEDRVIDATLGHGYDALKLLSLIPNGFLYGLDIQQAAVDSTQEKLKPLYSNYQLYHQCHSSFPEEANQIKLIVYNLGYLPKSDKLIKTQTLSTIKSLDEALKRLAPGGVISVMCYVGHVEGKQEEAAILTWAQSLDKTDVLISAHPLVNRELAPVLYLIQKKLN